MKQPNDFKWLRVCIVLIVLTINSGTISAQKPPDSLGFIQIFDGKTLTGWDGDPAYWRVENGNLVGEITPGKLLKNNSFIIWRGGEPGNFELTLEYRITKDGNSGINYRSVELKELPYALKGYQSDIDGQNRYTGQNYEERARTTLAFRGEKVVINPPANPADSLKNHIDNNAWTEKKITGSLGDANSLKEKIHVNGWNVCHLIARGNHLQHFVNGTLMSDVTDNDPLNRKQSGLLGVQVHVGPAMKVEYRNIRLKKL